MTSQKRRCGLKVPNIVLETLLPKVAELTGIARAKTTSKPNKKGATKELDELATTYIARALTGSGKSAYDLRSIVAGEMLSISLADFLGSGQKAPSAASSPHAAGKKFIALAQSFFDGKKDLVAFNTRLKSVGLPEYVGTGDKAVDLNSLAILCRDYRKAVKL